MLKKTALLVKEGFPYDLTFVVGGVYKSFISTGSNVCLLSGRKVRQYQFVAYSIGSTEEQQYDIDKQRLKVDLILSLKTGQVDFLVLKSLLAVIWLMGICAF